MRNSIERLNTIMFRVGGVLGALLAGECSEREAVEVKIML